MAVSETSCLRADFTIVEEFEAKKGKVCASSQSFVSEINRIPRVLIV